MIEVPYKKMSQSDGRLCPIMRFVVFFFFFLQPRVNGRLIPRSLGSQLIIVPDASLKVVDAQRNANYSHI